MRETHQTHQTHDTLPSSQGTPLPPASFPREAAPLAAEEQPIADAIAPTRVEVLPTHLAIGERVACFFALTGFPSRGLDATHTLFDLLRRLQVPLDITQHVIALDPATTIREMEVELTKLESQRHFANKQNRVNQASTTVGAEAHATHLERLTRGTDATLSTALLIGLSASSLERLENRAQQLAALLCQHGYHLLRMDLQHDLAYRTSQPLCRDVLGCRTNVNRALSAMPFFASPSLASTSSPSPTRVYLGTNVETGEPVFIDPWDPALSNGSLGIYGNVGSGKSMAGKVLGTRLLYTGRVTWAIMTPTAEYDLLCEAVEGQKLSFAPGSPWSMNPFDLPVTESTVQPGQSGQLADLLPDLIANLLLPQLRHLLTDTGKYTRDEMAVLHPALLSMYDCAGISQDGRILRASDLARPAPLLADLIDVLKRRAHRDSLNELAWILAERLELYTRFFHAPTNVRLDRPLTIFSTDGLADELAQTMVGLARTFLARSRGLHHLEELALFTFEEAWTMRATSETLAYLEYAARTMRKHGVAQVTISQNPNDIDTTISGLVSRRLLFQMDATTITRVAPLLGLTDYHQEVLIRAGRGEGLLFTGNTCAHCRVEASPHERALFTTDPRELMERHQREQQQIADTSDTPDTWDN